MEDVIEVYHRPYDPKRPVVCIDEQPIPLIGETRTPIPAAPGRPERYDYEYTRNGTANLFLVFAPLVGWRHIEVTQRRTAKDFGFVPLPVLYWPMLALILFGYVLLTQAVKTWLLRKGWVSG